MINDSIMIGFVFLTLTINKKKNFKGMRNVLLNGLNVDEKIGIGHHVP